MSLSVHHQIMMDAAGWSFVFRPTEVFLSPTTEELGGSTPAICQFCACMPCFGRFFRPVPESGLINDAVTSHCMLLPFAAMPSLFWKFIHLFHCPNDLGRKPRIVWARRFEMMVHKAREQHYTLIHYVYHRMGLVLPSPSYGREQINLNSLTEVKIKAHRSILSVLTTSRVAMRGYDLLVNFGLLYAFNLADTRACPSRHAAKPLDMWMAWVESLPDNPESCVNLHDEEIRNLRDDGLVTRSYASTLVQCVRIAMHWSAVSGADTGTHFFVHHFPWCNKGVPTGDRWAWHQVLRNYVGSSDSILGTVGRAFYPPALSSRESMSNPSGYKQGCPVFGCVPTPTEWIQQIRGGYTPAFLWIGLRFAEVDKATRSGHDVKCAHGQQEDYMELNVVVPAVMEQVRNYDAVQVINTLSNRSSLIATQELKQLETAPTSRCAGFLNRTPACNEMGLLLR